MLIIAHRGAASLEPENTIRSFTKAQEVKADMIELDVRETRDGEMIIIHDYSLHRLFKVHKYVALTTLAELKAISRAQGREIPTLAEALANITIPINFHIKVYGIEKKFLEAIKNFTSEVLISSTFPSVLKKIRALDAKVRLGLIIGRGELHLLPLLRYLTKSINLYSVHPKYLLANVLTIKLWRTLGKQIIVWDVNEPRELQRMQELKVDGVITDNPQYLAQKYE